MSSISFGTFPGGVSGPASHNNTLFLEFEDNLLASTDPAEPPPIIIKSYIIKSNSYSTVGHILSATEGEPGA